MKYPGRHFRTLIYLDSKLHKPWALRQDICFFVYHPWLPTYRRLIASSNVLFSVMRCAAGNGVEGATVRMVRHSVPSLRSPLLQ
ncbi:hypothetical protein DPEC_G00278480 [Dallia pectoralis]|uniref:Uncharacterized protein n=1 Tax=Dallia pectoralis TaxID=75939 RepID=A0ACC2FM83_DALPE|nr:hypothetical protein DPEC_G00278480 [Dallia pectoralis]